MNLSVNVVIIAWQWLGRRNHPKYCSLAQSRWQTPNGSGGGSVLLLERGLSYPDAKHFIEICSHSKAHHGRKKLESGLSSLPHEKSFLSLSIIATVLPPAATHQKMMKTYPVKSHSPTRPQVMIVRMVSGREQVRRELTCKGLDRYEAALKLVET